MQFSLWAPDLNVITYIGTAAAREVIRSYEFGASNKKLKMNVLLTTYELTLRDAKDLGEIKWQALAVDEVRYCAILVSSLLIGIVTGAPSQELGKSAVRGSEIVPCGLKASHHRHTPSKQCERCMFPQVSALYITD